MMKTDRENAAKGAASKRNILTMERQVTAMKMATKSGIEVNRTERR